MPRLFWATSGSAPLPSLWKSGFLHSEGTNYASVCVHCFYSCHRGPLKDVEFYVLIQSPFGQQHNPLVYQTRLLVFCHKQPCWVYTLTIFQIINEDVEDWLQTIHVENYSFCCPAVCWSRTISLIEVEKDFWFFCQLYVTYLEFDLEG